MKDTQNGLGVRNISDLVLKEIYSIYKANKKFDNISEDELNAKNNEEVYAKNDFMTTAIKRCRGEKKETKDK